MFTRNKYKHVMNAEGLPQVNGSLLEQRDPA